jgi:hypothetical protein
MASIQQDPGVAPPADSGTQEMFAEIDHDFGNIVHRMYYWSEVLEDKAAADPDGTEAVSELKEALTELHILLGRVMEFFKPVEMHLFSLPVEDLVARVSCRVGCANAVGLDSLSVRSLLSREVEVDPMQLDRAIDMVAEALVSTQGSASRPDIDAVRVDAVSKDDQRGIQIRLSARPNTEPSSALGHVNRGLVSRILGCMKWQLRFRDDGKASVCDLFIPLA